MGESDSGMQEAPRTYMLFSLTQVNILSIHNG